MCFPIFQRAPVYKLLSFYKYIHLDDLSKLQADILNFCMSNSLRGKIYLAGEGINGNISGEGSGVESFREFMTTIPEFSDVWFKEDSTESYVYSKMHVRIKKELVHLGIEGQTNEHSGKRLKPADLVDLYASGKEFIIVDTRNRYESEVGYFEGALRPEMKNFREWGEIADNLAEYKDKTVVTYCTGGIRCEKASAVLLAKGFRDVYQLDGGIITFVKQFPDTIWKGGVFVFDERKVLEPNQKPELKYGSHCLFCNADTNYYINCHNLECDKLFVVCKSCAEHNEYCCSSACKETNTKRTRIYT